MAQDRGGVVVREYLVNIVQGRGTAQAGRAGDQRGVAVEVV